MFTLRTLPAEPDTPRPEVAESQGFSLHAGVAAKASQHDKIERLARYVSKPPVAAKRRSPGLTAASCSSPPAPVPGRAAVGLRRDALAFPGERVRFTRPNGEGWGRRRPMAATL